MVRLLLSALLVLVCVAGARACSTSADCTEPAETCDTSQTTAVCTCNTAGNFAGTSPNCACDTNYKAKSDGSCGLIVGQPCSAATDCVDNTACNTNCECASGFTVQTDGTCAAESGASTVVSTLLLLVTSLVASTRLA